MFCELKMEHSASPLHQFGREGEARRATIESFAFVMYGSLQFKRLVNYLLYRDS